MASKIKALQQWCRKMTEGYRDVDVKDFTVSWRNGLAFCALVHRFRPDLIDYDSLSKENVYDNNHLAFTVAEQELDIPAFLEASDMVALKTPDKLSIITYVSQYYNKLHALPQLGGPGVKGKTAAPAAGVKRHQKSEPLSEPEPKKVTPAGNAAKGDSTKGKTSTLGDRCKICGNKVYLLERHIEGGQLYHRSCYRHSDLSPTNKVYSRSPFFSPSLHGKDETKTSTPKASPGITSVHKAPDLSRTYDLDNKHGSKQHETAHSDHKKSGVQKFLFSDKEKTSSKPSEHKSEAKDVRKAEGNGHVVKDLYKPSDLKSDKRSSATPTFDARTFEKHSTDFLSSEKDAKDVKTAKRQLPLIFQAPHSSDDTPHSSSSSKPASTPVSGSAAKKDGDLKIGHVAKSAAAGEKSATPMARPRQLGKKVEEEKMDTTETVQLREKTPAMPRPAPRTSLASSDQKKTSPTPKQRHIAARPKSPAKDLSPESAVPPPLPSSAPPPLPLTAPPSSHPPSHKPESHLTSKDRHLDKKSTHSAVSLSSTSTSSVTSSASSLSSARVPAHSRPLAGLTSVSHPPSSAQSTTSTSSISLNLSTPTHQKPAEVVFRIPTGARKEEPMDIDTAVDKARTKYGEEPVAVMVVPVDKGKQEKKTLTGLLHSLANVRSGSSSSAAPAGTTSVSISTTTTSTRTTLTSHTDKTHAESSNPTLTQPKTTAAGFVSGKLSRFQTKETDSKADSGSALKHKGHDEASGVSSAHAHATHRIGTTNVSSITTKVHETRTDTRTPSSGVSHTPKHGKGDPFDHTDEKSRSALKTPVGRRDRAKSAADVLGINDAPSKKDASADPAPFLQVKLRNANAAGEKKERPKSAGTALESEDASSKPKWQLDAERRMAAFQSSGFIDPETKKATGGGEARAAHKEPSKLVKNGTAKEQPNMTFQKLATDFSRREDEVPEKKSHADSKAGAKVPLHSELQVKSNKPAATAAEKQKESKADHKVKVLPTILHPVKPDRSHGHEETGVPQSKTRSEVSKTADSKQPSHTPVETEAQRMLKKITLPKDDHTPPPRPSSPPKQPRKKISVDVSFDFNSSNTLTREEPQPPVEMRTTTVKHTPPARPPPPSSSTNSKMSPGQLSAIELQQQLLDIDSKLTELELRGRQLEDSIRSAGGAEEEDDMMMEWFSLVTEKNDLVRKETDLVYMTREQELEGEQSQIENQLRYLLSKDEAEKSFEEQQEEEYLIQRKLDIVNQRNTIVDSMDEDRLRYEEEDRDIEKMLHSKGLGKDNTGQVVNEKGKRVATSTFYT
ncbi:hypothetical protein BaRGS_00001016 [Batillaria attramentaria]|uniref:Calponin-homology (CH) domain-containing protein n=1 Tax=Batillaria attramentaria TaxID=370345 RepID=A0ABD0M9H6_9CAEN